jgi:2'-5' RNA ligase
MEMGFVQSTEKIVVGAGRPSLSPPSEYLLVVYPHGDMQDRLLEAQQQFSAGYGLDHRLDQAQRIPRNRPHITLSTFQAGEEAEEILIRWLRRICQDRRGFDLALNNYSGIPPHTIFLRVQDPEPLRELLRQLDVIDEFIQSSGWPPLRRNTRPYLSIAGGLTEQVYNKAMPDYSRKTFHGVFRVTELVLIRRRHPFDPCKTVNVFGLKS